MTTAETIPQNAFGTLAVRDFDKAQELASKPIAEIDPDASAYVPEKMKPVTYDLDRPRLRLYWGEFLDHHTTHKASKGWLDTFKPLLSDVVGEKPTLLVYQDREVARFKRDGILSMKRLANEQPQIIAKYTRMMWRETFDVEAFKREEPAMYAAYRGRRLTLVNKDGAPLILPA